ncbi:U4 U6 small nuclear ribonucleo [Pyrenophora seminiperda CCB06]|uniref:U4 U6 small nuclear ribonucleo n=1 Tax=Pyrenophora seminiperda CCB06 TaxID=1302712 RepID=A0A3M7M8Y3_9PLEO|nr:U4 U6 small nuclear ribonucleo [Pyrenophora seminiperda CCB06]
MYLTTKEQQKLRRMRRAADLKEHQAKIRLGLEPPPPPKVKRGNMMRVMGEQAIADPTAVEMLVEGQIQQRHDDHVAANEDRMLTKEEKQAKLTANQEKDAQKDLYITSMGSQMCVRVFVRHAIRHGTYPLYSLGGDAHKQYPRPKQDDTEQVVTVIPKPPKSYAEKKLEDLVKALTLKLEKYEAKENEERLNQTLENHDQQYYQYAEKKLEG